MKKINGATDSYKRISEAIKPNQADYSTEERGKLLDKLEVDLKKAGALVKVEDGEDENTLKVSVKKNTMKAVAVMRVIAEHTEKYGRGFPTNIGDFEADIEVSFA